MILLYHLVFPDSTPKGTWNAGLVLRVAQFKRQLMWLTHRYQIVKLEDYVSILRQEPQETRGKVAITFDDGYRSVVDLVAPFLESQQVPATFFCTTRHVNQQDLLWFVYINALCSERVYQQITVQGTNYRLDSREPSLKAWRAIIKLARESEDPIGFAADLENQYPLPSEVMRKYAGVTKEQLMELGRSKILTLGGHTHNHPYLDQISYQNQVQEMSVNKKILEDLSGKPVSLFAYTGGVYNSDSIVAAQAVGFDAAFAIASKNIGADLIFEIPRTDIYSPSLMKFKLKLSGYPARINTLLGRG